MLIFPLFATTTEGVLIGNMVVEKHKGEEASVAELGSVCAPSMAAVIREERSPLEDAAAPQPIAPH